MIPPPPDAPPKIRKHLSADALHAALADGFDGIPDHRPKRDVSLKDALLSAFALFSLKDPSLLAFDQRRQEGNLNALYGIGVVPSDTAMREILDPVDPESLRPAFREVFRRLQRGKVLESMDFYQGAYLLALDGAGYFSSDTVHCDACLQKNNSKTGKTSYSHQLAGPADCLQAVRPAERRCSARRWFTPIFAKSSRWRRSPSSNKTGRRKTTANATPPSGCCPRFLLVSLTAYR